MQYHYVKTSIVFFFFFQKQSVFNFTIQSNNEVEK